MAELKSSVLGKVRGKVGTVSGRVRNGKNYLASLPASFNAPTDPASIARREKFKMAVHFAKAINADKKLKTIWNSKNTDYASVFNMVMQQNYKLLQNNSPSSLNIISPIDGFRPDYSAAEYLDGTLTITANPLQANVTIDPAVETKISANGFIFAADPSSEMVDVYQFVNFASAAQAIVTDVAMTFTVDLPYVQKMQLDNYQSISIYSSLITLTEDEVPVQYSFTSVN